MNKRLGQHSLVNNSAINKIISALDLKSGETIIEIGPGKGALTIPLAEKCEKTGCKIVAIEKDHSLVTWLLGKLVTWTNSEIIKGDALRLINQVTNQLSNWKLAGNIPYYITGKLLRIIGDLNRKPELTVLTIQKEVAERICAQKGEMNLLAAITQAWAKPEIIGYLKPSDFNPPPKVESAIIKLETKARELESGKWENYCKMVKIIFKQPRKTLLNNLSFGLKIAKNELIGALRALGFDEKTRPQALSLKDLAVLVDNLS